MPSGRRASWTARPSRAASSPPTSRAPDLPSWYGRTGTTQRLIEHNCPQHQAKARVSTSLITVASSGWPLAWLMPLPLDQGSGRGPAASGPALDQFVEVREALEEWERQAPEAEYLHIVEVR
jgi:hypothetical protein